MTLGSLFIDQLVVGEKKSPRRITPIPVPKPGSDPLDWAVRLVPVLEQIASQLSDSDADLNTRTLTLETGLSDVRVAKIYASKPLDRSTLSTHILVYSESGNTTVTLPPAEKTTGKVLLFKKMSAGNSVIIKPSSGKVEGAASLTLTTQYMSRTLICDGADWWIV